MFSSPTRWLLWRDHDHHPARNMAIDEALLERISEYDMPLLRIYEWDRPAVSIGYSQDYAAATVDEEDYEIVRRPTGGGVVFHTNDLTYTAVIPPANSICSLNRNESYQVFHEALLIAFTTMGVAAGLHREEQEDVDRRVMKCFVTPSKFDVVSVTGKHAGAAQRRSRMGILHQGSILLDNLPCSKPGLTTALIRAMQKKFNIDFVPFKPDQALLDRATELEGKKYTQKDWNLDRKDG